LAQFAYSRLGLFERGNSTASEGGLFKEEEEEGSPISAVNSVTPLKLPARGFWRFVMEWPSASTSFERIDTLA